MAETLFKNSRHSSAPETVAQTRRRTFWWWILGLALLPIAVYGGFPIVATTLLTEALTQQGFQHITIRLGYPTVHALPIYVLAFEKEISGEWYHVTLNDMSLEYQISQLLKGQLQRMVIGGGKLVIHSSNATSTQNANRPDSAHTPSLTVEELLAPFPMPPFEQLIVGAISIHRSEVDDPLQHLLLNGSIDTNNGTLRSHFDIQGSHIPHYTVTLSGTSIGDSTVTVLSPQSLQPTLVQFSSQTRHVDENLQLEGGLNIDIHNVVKLVDLFFPIDRDLSQMTGTITADWRGTLPPSASVEALVQEKVGTIAGTVQIRAALPQLKAHAQDLAVEATSTFSATHDELTWTLSKGSRVLGNIHIDPLSLPESVRSIIPINHHTLSIDISKPVTGRIPLTEAPLSLTIDGLIQGDYRIKNFPVTVQFSLEHISGRSLQDLMANGQFFFSGTLDKQLPSQFSVQKIKWNLAGDMSLRNEKLTVTVAPKSSVHTALLPINELLIPQVDLTFLKKFTGAYELSEQKFETSSLVLDINTPQVTWNDKMVTTQRGNLTINELQGSLSTWKTAGQIVVLGIETTINDITPPTTNVKLVFSVNPQYLHVNLLGQTEDTQVSLYGKLLQNHITREGEFQFKLAPITYSPSDFNLRNSFTPWKYPLDITTGQTSAEGNAFWTLSTDVDEQPFTLTKAKLNINVDKLGGHYGNIIFDGLSTTMTLVGAKSWSMPNPAILALRKLETGVNISDISMNLLLTPTPNSAIPIAKIDTFSAQMFAGKISTDDFVFDPTKSRHQLTLHANGLDIGAILNLEQQEGLKGTGLLDGTIPVTLTEKGVEVEDGNLAARPPGGIIRYQTAEDTAETLKQTSKNMNLVLQALNNFHYDVLSIGADYDHDGKLLLKTKLQGKNPDLYLGKRIHFNLNVEENIPALLKSLQVAKDIEGRIEKLLQRSEKKLLGL